MEELEREYVSASAAVARLTTARNVAGEGLKTAQRAFAVACNDLAQAEERLHSASEKLTDARTEYSGLQAASQ